MERRMNGRTWSDVIVILLMFVFLFIHLRY
jgi:hypothetical protein